MHAIYMRVHIVFMYMHDSCCTYLNGLFLSKEINI